MKIAFVLWEGSVGGAERVTASLACELARRHHAVEFVFVTHGGSLVDVLDKTSLRHRSLGLTRGRDVGVHPRRLARAVTTAGCDAAVTVTAGYLPAVLRAGGYRGSIVAVNHGRLLHRAQLSYARRLILETERAIGCRAAEAEVAVSDFMLAQLVRERFRARRVTRIYNGLQLADYARDGSRTTEDDVVRVVWAGRMVPGKGVEDLLQAMSIIPRNVALEVVLAGDGPLRPEPHYADLTLDGRDSFPGVVQDMAGLLNAADVAAAVSSALVESFGFFALEAMACGLPVVATRNGGLTEVVADGETGFLVSPGDVDGIAAALESSGTDPTLRRRHGSAARERCAAVFSVERAADEYVALLGELTA